MSKLEVFSKFQPISLDLVKNSDDTISIEGIATTEHEDSHGEIILQNGIDWSYCLKSGALNYDHQNDPKYILGAPQSVQKTTHNGKAATKIKGILYAQKAIVKDIVENFKAMKNAGDVRKLGFSIEGQVLARDNKNPNIITRAKVLNVSLTHNPANTEATIALVKNILSSIEEKNEDMTEDLNKNDEYNDLHMTLGEARLACDYAEKLKMMLEAMPEDADLPEWVQKKISMSKEYLQTAFHYLEQEKEEGMMDKDVSPEYLDGLDEESVVAPEKVEPKYEGELEKACDYKTEKELDKMDARALMDYIRFLDGIKKEECMGEDCEGCPECMDKQSDLSPIQPQSLEDDDKPLASEDHSMNMGEDDEEEEEELEVEIEGLSLEDVKELLLQMIKLNLPIEQMKAYLERYIK